MGTYLHIFFALMNLKDLTCDRSFGETQQNSKKRAGHSCFHPLNLRSHSGKFTELVGQEGFEALCEIAFLNIQGGLTQLPVG